MPTPSPDLHGNAPDTAPAALVLVDVISDLEFEGGERLFPHALAAARRIAGLKRAVKALGIPVVYANDNFGRWRSDFRQVVEHVRHDGVRGAPIAELVLPEADDYFVLKPKHSAFFATTLNTLLDHFTARHILLAGFTGDRCVLFTVVDALLRDFHVTVPADCTASIDPEDNETVLGYLRRVFAVDTTPSDRLDLWRLLREAEEGSPPGDARRVTP
ncbi:MAG TPA: isochorismatase family cysteine hydrolase [Gemmatimonadaceae bacterium]|nr:isochorismatase family cysteine hydrolase [Gemmatimonadaceae bacterium]